MRAASASSWARISGTSSSTVTSPSIVAPAIRGDFVAAERAEPGEERGLAAPRPGLPDGDHERRLRDVLGRVLEPDARHGEAIEPRVIGVEELVEGAFIAAPHAPDQVTIVGDVHLPGCLRR